MRHLTFNVLSVVLCCSATASSGTVRAAAPPVQLELVTEQGFPITGAHEWSRALGRLELGRVRIRSMQHGERPKITNRGSENNPSYHVLGVLSSKNRLRLPAGTYGLGDMARLKKYLTSLQENAAKKNAAPVVAFGLTAEELQGARDSLRAPVQFDTKGEPAAEVVRRITRTAKLTIQMDAAARTQLAKAEPVFDNVKDISTGTSLAVVLRPYGLMLQPQKQTSGKIEFRITKSKKNAEAWPIGWTSEKSDAELLPVMLERLNAEIDNFTLTETLAALQPRMKIPFLLDHNAMARHQLNPNKAKIVIPPKRTYYKSLLKKVFFQARMKSEVRVDEAGQPLLWITTIKH